MTNEQIEQEIDRIAALQHDWDSYGGDPFSEAVITHARDYSKELQSRGLPVVSVAPSDGIVFYLRFDHILISVEVYEDGSKIAAISNRSTMELNVWEITSANVEDSYALIKRSFNVTTA